MAKDSRAGVIRMTGQGLPGTVARMVRSGARVPDSWVPWRLPATVLGAFARSILPALVPEAPPTIIGIDR